MSGPVLIVGLGPAGLDRLPASLVDRLCDPALQVVARTLAHPAAADLAARRPVEACDDLYETLGTFDEVYAAIAGRVLERTGSGPVAYIVPGSALVAERAVALLRERAAAAGVAFEVVPGESFLDLVFDRIGLDPFDRGVQVLDARALPEPLLLHLPTVIGQVDTSLVLGEVRDALLRLLGAETEVMVLTDLGSRDERVERVTLEDLRGVEPGLRVSLFLDPVTPGWPGLVRTNARLRTECPWDRRQTHHTLAKHLLEEAHETLEAIEALPEAAPGGEPDFAAYAELEEELGDLLLQVVFHATLAEETGAFGVEEVAEGIRRKLVRRHPHVFGDVEVDGAEHVVANWEQIKQAEKRRESLLDGVAAALPALARAWELQARAATVGFDWPDRSGVFAKVHEELDEVAEVADGPADRRTAELGDLLFAVVNLARHLEVDPEQALRTATARFERRFRVVEDGGTLAGVGLDELERRWQAAKAAEEPDEG
jgi:tetrapyrrole methylase family protein/MazG family protein